MENCRIMPRPGSTNVSINYLPRRIHNYLRNDSMVHSFVIINLLVIFRPLNFNMRAIYGSNNLRHTSQLFKTTSSSYGIVTYWELNQMLIQRLRNGLAYLVKYFVPSRFRSLPVSTTLSESIPST